MASCILLLLSASLSPFANSCYGNWSWCRFANMLMLLYVYPVQMDQLMLISANPLRSTLRATLSCHSAAKMDSGGEATTERRMEISAWQILNHNS